MAIKEITPQQAHDLLVANPNAVYIDVRTEREFTGGHPQGAVNIPFAFQDPARGMTVNEEFVDVVRSHFVPNQKIILGCQAGPRSSAAAGTLEQAGFQDISNVIGGFGGMRDQTGRMITPGWASLGLPVSQENGEGVSYDSLRGKSKGPSKNPDDS